MALTHKLKDDSQIVYPFGAGCAGYANSIITQTQEAANGETIYTDICEELTQDIIDLYKERDEESFNELFEVVGEGKKSKKQ